MNIATENLDLKTELIYWILTLLAGSNPAPSQARAKLVLVPANQDWPMPIQSSTFYQGCRENFSVGGEDGRETEISADKYSIYAAPKAASKFSEHWLDWNDDKTSRIW